MIIEISRHNWTQNLADAIKMAKNGDVIKCHSEEMKKLAVRAHTRMCPNKTLMFRVQR